MLNTHMKSCRQDSLRTAGCRCRRFVRQAGGMCITLWFTFDHQIPNVREMPQPVYRLRLPISAIRIFNTTRTGPTVTCFWYMPLGVRRIDGLMEWPNSFLLDRILSFKCITRRTAVRTSIRHRLVWFLRSDCPEQRVITLQLTNDHFAIPPETDNYRVEAWGTLPNDATLLSFLPHMHLRGKRFEYNIVHDRANIETLLRVNYDFFWQLSYRLAEPLRVKAGTKIQAVAWYG